MSRWLRTLILILACAIALPASMAACSSGDDDATVAPKVWISPVDGKPYCTWVETSTECPGPPGPPAAPFAMPQDKPDRDHDHLSALDFLLLMSLFNRHESYAPYYHRPWYYDNYIRPGWDRHPGPSYARPGIVTIQHTTVNNYGESYRKFDTTYASDEKAKAKTAEYTTAGGKKYRGDKLPSKAFSGTNVRVDKPAGDAPVGTKPGPKPSGTQPSASTVDKGKTTRSTTRSGGSSSRSSGGGHK